VLNGCVGALDGYLQCIAATSHKECGNVGAYFSGHYWVYGVNIQAMRGADCRLLFVSLLSLKKLMILLQFRKKMKHCLQSVLLQQIVLTALQNM
jgi:hypothetical protein